MFTTRLFRLSGLRTTVAWVCTSVLFLLAGATAFAAESSGSGYRWQTNIVYRSGAEVDSSTREKCQLDVYYPAGITNFSTVIWFHGGGLTGGRRSVPRGLQDKGIAIVAASYRLSPEVKSPVYIEDAASAVAWTFHNIARFGGAANRVFVSGHSAGGYLASMVGLDRRWLAVHGVDANRIAGLIPYSGHTITHFTIRAERGIPDTRPVVDEFAPLFHVRKDAPPMLLITGDRNLELLGRYEENAYFWRMLRQVGHADSNILELDGYDHGGMAEPAHPLLIQFVRRISSKP